MEGRLQPQRRSCAHCAAPVDSSGGNLMRRLIFGLVVAAGAAAYSQAGAGATAASTGTAGHSAGLAAADHNPNDVEWTEHGGYQSTPLVIDGVLYMTAPWSSLYAFDAKSGKPLWKVDPQAPREIAATSICCNISNRGAAYADGKIIWGTIDGRLMAVNAKTGQKSWEARVADPKLQYSITGAPRIGDGLVFIGV